MFYFYGLQNGEVEFLTILVALKRAVLNDG
jgi:hypothetical protein